MSNEAAIRFIRRVVETPELQKKFVAFAKEQGYEFSVDELLDSELDKVAGGFGATGTKTSTEVAYSDKVTSE